MSKSHNNNVLIPSSSPILIAGGASAVLDIDLETVENLQFLVEVSYDNTHSTTTGVSIDLKGGFGGKDASITDIDPLPHSRTGSSAIFSDNVEAVTMTPVTTSLGATTTFRTNFYLSEIGIKWPRWVRLELTNTDVDNEATISIRLDM